MYFVYILESQKHHRHYVGSCVDTAERIKRHNAGRNKSTKNGIPWEIIYTESFTSRQEAYKRELQIKSYKGGEAFKKLIKK